VRIPSGSVPSDSLIEVATSDHRFHGQLQPAHGLTLAGPQVVIARFVPSALLGPLATGLLQYRVGTGGLPSDWHDLAWVARLPEGTSIDCNGSGTDACALKGRNLFLLEQLRVGEGESARLRVPEGYTDEVLRFPRPATGEFSFTLRDHPGAQQPSRVPAVREAAAPMVVPAPPVAAPAPAAAASASPAPGIPATASAVAGAGAGAADAGAPTATPPAAAPPAAAAPAAAAATPAAPGGAAANR
jgi:hypothetical protein